MHDLKSISISICHLELPKYSRCLLARDIVIEYHGLGDLHSRKLLFIILETKSLTKVPTDLIPLVTFPWFVNGIIFPVSSYGHLRMCLHPHLFLEGHWLN